MDAQRKTVGLVGLGHMGSVMAQHLLAGGWQVIGWDKNPEAVSRFVTGGGSGADTLGEVAAADLIISIVFDDAGTREITLGPDGLVSALRPGCVHAVMASISPALSRELSDAHTAHQQRYVAASVFGRPEAAGAAELLFNCSGDEIGYRSIAPVLDLLGTCQWAGDQPEQSMLVKTFGNAMIYTTAQVLREMFAFLKAGGIPEHRAKELLIDTLFGGTIHTQYAQRYLDDHDSVHMTELSAKDRRTCLAAAQALGVELPLMQFLDLNHLP